MNKFTWYNGLVDIECEMGNLPQEFVDDVDASSLIDKCFNAKEGGDVMKAVLITYKSSSRTRVVPQATVRATATRMYHRLQEEAIVSALGTMHQSLTTIGPKEYWTWQFSLNKHKARLDMHCWKRSNKKAHRGWQRHSNRTKCRNRCSRAFGLTYYPSIKLLNRQGGVL